MRVLDASVVTDAVAVSGPGGDAARRVVAAEAPLHAPAILVARVWELRDTVKVYDAWYVALAEALSTDLVTADARLRRSAGARCRLLTPTEALAAG